MSPRLWFWMLRIRVPLATPFSTLMQTTLAETDAQIAACFSCAELHQHEELGAELIVVERVPERAEWQAIKDRLSRASTFRT